MPYPSQRELLMESRSDSDEDLLLYMSWQEDDSGGARAAFEEFHRRHVKYLFAVCLRAYGDDLGHDGVADLVQETFWRVYKKASLFNPLNLEDQDRARRRVRAWMAKIANRLVLDGSRKEARHVRLLTDDHGRIDQIEFKENSCRELSEEEQLVRRAMNEVLNERERAVVEAFASYYDPESDHQKPPKGLIDDLCRRIGTTSENVRQLRRRGLAKLEEFVAANCNIERSSPHVPRQGQQRPVAQRG